MQHLRIHKKIIFKWA